MRFQFLALALFLASLAPQAALSQCSLSVGNDTVVCAGQSVELAVTANIFADSIEIIYDATQGTTTLPGASKVYMHSAAEIQPFGGWQFIVGNWGQDDGIGEMTSIGTDLWRIVIEPYSYYGVPSQQDVIGLFMVFRNDDGTLEGKDDTNSDIYVDVIPQQPTTAFAGVVPARISDPVDTIFWSTGSSELSILVSDSGWYSATLIDSAGCIATDSVLVSVTGSEVNLGAGLGVCDSSNIAFTLDAGPNGLHYQWTTPDGPGDTTATISDTVLGTYAVTVEYGNNCVSSDSVEVYIGLQQGTIDLGNDTAICGFGPLLLNPNITLSPCSDSLIITYDATAGQGLLTGEPKVYMHAAAEINAGAGWEYLVGNWGDDDGVGEMINVGANLWQLKIHPPTYFGFNCDSVPLNIYLRFRNPDGSIDAGDAFAQDVVLEYNGTQAISSFEGVVIEQLQSTIATASWSTGASSADLLVNNSGTYWVEVSDVNGCVANDTVEVVVGSLPLVEIGNDVDLCTGETVTLDAGTGYASYSWSDGSGNQTFTVDSTGLYGVTVTNAAGCEGFDMVSINVVDPPVADFSTSVSGGIVSFTDNSVGAVTYAWDFDGDGQTDDQTAGSVSWLYYQSGTFSPTLTVSNACSTDVFTGSVTVVGLSELELDHQLKLFPNPTSHAFQIAGASGSYQVLDAVGRVVLKGRLTARNPTRIDVQHMPPGAYIVRISTAQGTFHKRVIIN